MAEERTMEEKCRIVLRHDNITLPKGDGDYIHPHLVTSVEEARRLAKEEIDGYNDSDTLMELLEDGGGSEEEARRRIKEREPVAMISLSRLDKDRESKEKRVFRERVCRRVELYDLGWRDAFHVVTIGTGCECDLRPLTRSVHQRGRSARECIQDYHTDRVPVDQTISDLHGVIFMKQEKLFYRDKSASGSSANGSKFIFNDRFPWDDFWETYIGVGPMMTIKKKDHMNATPDAKIIPGIYRTKEHRFKIRWAPYELSGDRKNDII